MPYADPKKAADYFSSDRRLQQQRDNWHDRYVTWNGRVTQLVGSARKRAKAKNLAFDLSSEHLVHLLEIQGYKCAVTGLPFCLKKSKEFKNPWSPSIDRINNDLGYMHDNIRIVCTMYNLARGQHTDEDLITLAKHILNPKQD